MYSPVSVDTQKINSKDSNCILPSLVIIAVITIIILISSLQLHVDSAAQRSLCRTSWWLLLINTRAIVAAVVITITISATAECPIQKGSQAQLLALWIAEETIRQSASSINFLPREASRARLCHIKLSVRLFVCLWRSATMIT